MTGAEAFARIRRSPAAHDALTVARALPYVASGALIASGVVALLAVAIIAISAAAYSVAL